VCRLAIAKQHKGFYVAKVELWTTDTDQDGMVTHHSKMGFEFETEAEKLREALSVFHYLSRTGRFIRMPDGGYASHIYLDDNEPGEDATITLYVKGITKSSRVRFERLLNF